MKRALSCICIMVLAGLIFSSGVTVFEQAVHNIQMVLGTTTDTNAAQSLLAYQ